MQWICMAQGMAIDGLLWTLQWKYTLYKNGEFLAWLDEGYLLNDPASWR